MPRVLIFANDNSTIYNFRRELLDRLVGQGYQVTLALPPNARNQDLREQGCDLVEIPVSRFGTNPAQEMATLLAFIRVIRQVKPDIVITYTVKPNIHGGLAAQVCGVPYISTVTGLGSGFYSGDFMRRIAATLQKLAFRRCSCVFFQNDANRREFLRLGIVARRTTVVPGSGVNLEMHALEPYTGGERGTRFITVSRIRHDKGFEELLTAIRYVCERRADVEFHVVGWFEEDSFRDEIAAMQLDYPLVIHGSVTQEQVHALIAKSHCLVHPSHHEGLANVILEASAAGVPCIASDIPGCREAIDDEITGFLFPVKDSAALAKAIERFLSRPWSENRSMGFAARRKVEVEFDREQVVDRYLAEIDRVLARSARKVESEK
mgnify:CR=1 FL=1